MLLNKEILIGIYGSKRKPTYSLVSNSNNVNEDGTIIFTVNTTNIPDNTDLYWTILPISTGVNSSDFADNLLSGSVTIISNTGTITKTLFQDLITEGIEQFRMQLRIGSVSGLIVTSSNVITINDTSKTPPPLPGPYSLKLEIDTTLV